MQQVDDDKWLSFKKEHIMPEKQKKGLVWIKDKKGKYFACRIEDLIDADNLSEEEKAQCLDPQDFDFSGMP